MLHEVDNVIRFPTKVGVPVPLSDVEEKKEPEWVQEVTRKLQAARLARQAKQAEKASVPPEEAATPVIHSSHDERRRKIIASLNFTSQEKEPEPEKAESPPPEKTLVLEAVAGSSLPIPSVPARSAVPEVASAAAVPEPPIPLFELEPEPPAVVPLDLDEVLHLREEDFAPALENKAPGPDRSILLSRILAGLVDFVIVLICSTPFFFTLNYLSSYEEINRFTLVILGGISILIYHLYSLFFLGFSGQTIGMMIAEIQVVDTRGDMPGHHQALGRTFFFLLSFILLGLGLGWSLFDRRCRCLQDILSATEVVRINEPFQPANATG